MSHLTRCLGLAVATLALGCCADDPYRDTSGVKLPAIAFDDVDVYSAPPPGFDKLGEIEFKGGSPRGRDAAREAARAKLKRTAARHGAGAVVIVREEVRGGSDPRGDAWVDVRADAGRVR